MRLFLIIILIHAFAILTASGVDRSETWIRANQMYSDGDYSAAIDGYETLMDDGYESEELYFNLGNAYYRNKEVAKAILSYERALKLKPRDKEVLHNLEIATSTIENHVIPVDEFFLVTWLKSVARGLSPMSWGLCFLVLLWITVLMILGKIRVPLPGKRKVPTYFAGALTAIALVFGIYSFALRESNKAAVIMQPANLLIAPDEESKELRQLDPGEKVHVIDSLDNFYKVRLMNYEAGWLPATIIERI